jgi:hypothetical protein
MGKLFKLVVLLTVLYLTGYYFYYGKVLNYVVDQKASLGIQGEYLQKFVKTGNIIRWVLMGLTVILIYVRIFFISLFLLAGTYLSKQVKLSYKEIVRIVLVAEFVFLIRDSLSIVSTVLSPIVSKPIMNASLSLDFIFGKFLLQYPFLAFPVKSISLYLLAYILVLSALMKKEGVSFSKGLGFTCRYFGVSFFVWLLLVVSFTLFTNA